MQSCSEERLDTKVVVRQFEETEKASIPQHCIQNGSDATFFLSLHPHYITVVSEFLPSVASISGFFANGVLGQLDGTIGSTPVGSNENMLHGSSSQYVVFRSSEYFIQRVLFGRWLDMISHCLLHILC